MPDNERGYIARRPRHRTADPAGFRVQVERAPGHLPGSIDVELVDLSRSGVRLRTAVPLSVEEAITVELFDEQSGLRLLRPATVRWRSRDEGGAWSHGCLFAQPVEWETLGEFFLHGLLSTSPPSGDA